MSLTLTSATTEIRNFLNEDTAAFWTDTEIQNWIKEGVRDFSSKSLMNEDAFDLTMTANQYIYTVSDEAGGTTKMSDLIEPYAFIYYDDNVVAKGLMKQHPRKLGNMLKFTSGVPRYCMFFDRTLYVWPYPSATEVALNAKIKILGSFITEDIADIHDEYQHIPLLYAKSHCKMKDMKFQESQALLSQYMTMANFERQDKHAREEDTYDQFKIRSQGGEARAQ